MIKLLVHNNKGEYELLDTHETEIDEVFFIKGEHFNHAETDRHAYHFSKKYTRAELVELGVYDSTDWTKVEDVVPRWSEGVIVDSRYVISYTPEHAQLIWENK